MPCSFWYFEGMVCPGGKKTREDEPDEAIKNDSVALGSIPGRDEHEALHPASVRPRRETDSGGPSSPQTVFLPIMRSTEATPDPENARHSVAASRVKGNSKPAGLKNPFFKCTRTTATAMSNASNNATKRVKRPRTSAMPPKNSSRVSAMAAACGAGIRSEAKNPATV